MVTTAHLQSPLYSSAPMVLEGITWQTYLALVQDLEVQPARRLTYDTGVLEIWMPLPPHETYKRWLGRIVEIVTEEMALEVRSLSASTWSRPDLQKGVEADECYYIQHEAAVRGKMQLDLMVDPPPDLAIEIDVTSLSLPRLSIYAALGVPELWRFTSQEFTILGLGAGGYERCDRSLALPIMTAAGVAGLLEQAQEMGETSWAKLVRQWVRSELEGTMKGEGDHQSGEQ